MSDENKVSMGDTMKNMAKEPGEALKKDYEQTKADMENMKDKAMNKKDEAESEVSTKMKDTEEDM
jgi:hypothetical protein